MHTGGCWLASSVLFYSFALRTKATATRIKCLENLSGVLSLSTEARRICWLRSLTRITGAPSGTVRPRWWRSTRSGGSGELNNAPCRHFDARRKTRTAASNDSVSLVRRPCRWGGVNHRRLARKCRDGEESSKKRRLTLSGLTCRNPFASGLSGEGHRLFLLAASRGQTVDEGKTGSLSLVRPAKIAV